MGWIPEREASGLSRLMEEHGGFAPNGLSAVVGAFITIMFSFIGTEAVTIAAAESNNPAQNIARATRSVIVAHRRVLRVVDLRGDFRGAVE